jgi:hypothetical protein
MKRFKRWLEERGILKENELWIPPDHAYWYYYCWIPARGLKSKFSKGSWWEHPGEYLGMGGGE